VAIETVGTWHYQVIKLVKEIGKCTAGCNGLACSKGTLKRNSAFEVPWTAGNLKEMVSVSTVPLLPARPLQSVTFSYT